jgi:cytochrome c oxidase cbb3-type subunit 3
MNRPHYHPEHRARRAYISGAASAALAVAAVVACTAHDSAPNGLTARGEATGAPTAALPDIAGITSLSTGPLAGNVIDSARYAIHNPYDGNRAAMEEGQQLFIHMNCAYCHGFNGAGGMGPSLQGQSWRFGGDDADVFKTIYGGRGKGMPAWGAAITEDNIWKIVAYIRTLGTSPGTAAAAAPSGRRGTGVAGSEDTREPMKSVNEW